jgi:hypothetical protein
MGLVQARGPSWFERTRLWLPQSTPSIVAHARVCVCDGRHSCLCDEKIRPSGAQT